MDGYETKKPDALYARIERENRAAQKRGGSTDAFLRRPGTDTRMSVVLPFRSPEESAARKEAPERRFPLPS